MRTPPPTRRRRPPEGRSGYRLSGAQERIDSFDAADQKDGLDETKDLNKNLKEINRTMSRLSQHMKDNTRMFEKLIKSRRRPEQFASTYQSALHYASAYRHSPGTSPYRSGGTTMYASPYRYRGYSSSGSPYRGGMWGRDSHRQSRGHQRSQTQMPTNTENTPTFMEDVRANVRRRAVQAAGNLAWKGITAPKNIYTWGLEKYQQGIGTYMEQQAARAQSEALGGRRVRGIEGDAYAYGYRRTEAQQAYQQMMLARGERGARSGARSSLALSRGFGIDQASIFGMQRASRDSGDGSGADQINNALVASFKRTKFPRAFLGEFLQQSTRLLGQMSTGREFVKGSESSALLSTFSRSMGGVYGQSPTRSADLLSRVGQTIQNPQSEAGKAFTLRAMGFGQGKSYVQAMMQQEQGMTGDNVRRLLKQTRSEYGGMGKEMQALALHRLSGGKLKLFETMRLIGLDPESMSDTNIKEAISGSQRVDLAKEARTLSGRHLGAQRRMIGRENQLAKFAAANQNIANTFFEAEKTIMNAATKLAQGLNTLLGSTNKLMGTFKKVNTYVDGWSNSVSRWWSGKKSTKSKPGRRPNGSDDTPGL